MPESQLGWLVLTRVLTAGSPRPTVLERRPAGPASTSDLATGPFNLAVDPPVTRDVIAGALAKLQVDGQAVAVALTPPALNVVN